MAIPEDQARQSLADYGLVDANGNAAFYSYRTDSPEGQAYERIGRQFGLELMRHLDVEEMADLLEAPAGTAFLIAYHEICWQLLENLHTRQALTIPAIILDRGVDPAEEVRLVSVGMVPYPFNDPWLKTSVSDEERALIERFETEMETIRDGKRYEDLSTPVNALLTFIAAVRHHDFDLLSAANPGYDPDESGDRQRAEQFWEQMERQYIHLKLARLPRASTWKDGVCGLYVIYPASTELSGVEGFVQGGGTWGKLFNSPSLSYDWRADVPRFRKMVEASD
jgi:hypothetical protein